VTDPKKQLLTVKRQDKLTDKRNPKQVQNISVTVNAQLIKSKQRGTSNLADEIITLCTQVTENTFVRHVAFTSEHSPCIQMN